MSDALLQGGERLGAGPFGETWRVGGRVIKVAGPDWQRALPWGIPREIEVMQRGLAHPNIAPFLEHGATVERRPWIATDFVAGATVRELIIAERPPTVAEARAVGVSVGNALEAAHAVGVLHCDVNVHNVIVPAGAPERSALVDWGIAALVEPGGERVTRDRFKSGTPRYAAPEQRTPQTHSPATDVWGLGMLVYCMLYRRAPFAKDDLKRDGLRFPPGNQELQPLLKRALTPRPADRCSVADLVAGLSCSPSR